MRFLTSSLIKQTIMRVTFVTCGGFLLLASVGLFTFQSIAFRQGYTRDLSVLAEIIATNSTAALKSKKTKTAEGILSALRANPGILSAWIQLPDGKIFAHYGVTNPPVEPKGMPTDGSRFEGNQLLHGKPILLGTEQIGTLYLRSDFQTAHHQQSKLYAPVLAGVLVVSIVLAFMLSARLHRMISEPFQRLAKTAKVVTARKHNSEGAQKAADDGAGLFTSDFDGIITQIQAQDAALQQAHQDLKGQVAALQHEVAERKQAEERLNILHKQLLDASRQTGMAEVATGVLHNVGNVLNSVNVSVTLLQDRLRRSKTSNLAKLVAMLRDHAGDLGAFLTTDPKGQMIPSYLDQLSVHLEQENTDILQVMELVVKNMEHIKKIVAMQQNYAKFSAVTETLPAANLVEDALQIHAASLDRHGVKVARNYAEVPPVTLDKHKVLQILVNLVHNAKHALEEGGREDKVLHLGISRNGNNRLKISVTDNGIGIKPENLTRIFSHGFTTKKNGHGFGLHHGALAAKELQGSLIAHSDGPGRGATFTLELPFENPKGSV